MSGRAETLAWALHRLSALALAGGLAAHLLGQLGRPFLVLDADSVGRASRWYGALALIALVHAGLGLRRFFARAGRLRGRQSWLGWSARAHRWSGDLLAALLPLHLAVLTLALTAPDSFDRLAALVWGRAHEAVAAAIVAVAALHWAGGLRVLALEATASTRFQQSLAALAAGIAAAAGFAWLARPW